MTSRGVLSLATTIERGPQGVLYARCPVPLGPYPTRITERLEHWAGHASDRTFLARRGGDGGWRHLTYGQALTRVHALAQALIDRRLSAERPLVILSGNGIEHGLLALAAMHAGIPYAPIAPAYSLLARDYTTLKSLWASLRPGLVFAAEGERYEGALSSMPEPRAEIVTCSPAPSLRTTAFAELEAAAPTSAVHDARVTPDTVAKILYTSGSTGRPKGVVNTQRMLCSNQEMLRTVLPLLSEAPPVLCDWLPWNHTFGGNHNFGLVLYNGGTLYIDDGKPTPEGFEVTLMNLRDVATTAYFNVPRGYDLLVPRLAQQDEFRRHFFSRLQMLFCAAASLRQRIADDLTSVALQTMGTRIPLVTGLGATESAPLALCAGDADFAGSRVGVPVPAVELKLAPVGDKLEARLRGPNITPGYWRDPELTASAFDEEGYYRMGDALGFVDPGDPGRGFVFEGRLSEDFKLSTGTWVRVGPLRGGLLDCLAELVHDIVIAGHDRDVVTALIFPNLHVHRSRGPAAFDAALHERLLVFNARHPGSSTAIARAIVLDEPPAIDAHEVTDKGSVNQKAVLANRATLVEELYAEHPSHRVLRI